MSMNVKKDSKMEENEVQYTTENLESKGESLVLHKCPSKLDPDRTLVPSFRRSLSSSNSLDLSVPNGHGHHRNIPKHVTTFDEKYVLHCLELIRSYALRAAAGNFASKVHTLPDDLSSLAMECPSVTSPDDWTIGSITGSQSMMNILKSPLLQRFGSVDFDVDFRKTNFSGPPHKFSNTLSHKPQDEITVLDHRRVVSMSSMCSSSGSSCSDKTSSSAFITSFQGMLQSTWTDDGLPHHVFSVDDKREVYVAHVSKVGSSDYVYTFRSREKGVGTMRVSTSITLCSDNSEVRESRFVLSVSSDEPKRELEISNYIHRKNKRLTRKVTQVFRSSQSYKQRSPSKLWGSSAIFEDCPWEPSEDVLSHVPNLEVAAIIVRDIFKNQKRADLGGWGLKFLKKPINNVSLRSNGECSTSMNVLIPAGVHGGPKTGVGGPSGLIERWMSGGHCDCGGWDIGCPLTILNTGSSSTGSSSGEFKSIDLFMQGSKQEAPMVKMANIHEGLYCINFQSTLSTLQSFAIAAAIIHSHSPLLRSKVYRS